MPNGFSVHSLKSAVHLSGFRNTSSNRRSSRRRHQGPDRTFCSGQLTEEAHNLILVGGTGTGKTRIAIAPGTALINNGKKAPFFNAANQPFSAWDKVFPDQAVTVAAIDRLVHHATILEMNRDSYRRRAAAKRQSI
ncbi:ATP-binding protein [Paracoccus jeotgali]|uniref:ATP-binding protein n=1 Tax=Paracoccus jeotgali TaxID=2065379 RepID=UPI0035E44268